MKLQVKKTTTIISVSLMGVVTVITMAFFFLFNSGAHAQNEGGRLITVHDRGKELTFVTNKNTLGEALKDHNIVIDEKDTVEPAIEEQLVAPDYQVNIYRARPVVVVDNVTRQKIITPYQTAERIAKDAGITLYPEDILTLERSTDIVSDGAGLQLTIKRAIPITVTLFGKRTELRTQSTTVGDMLKEKKIELGENDRSSLPLTTPIVEGLEIRLWREGKQTITKEEDVPFETKTVKDVDRLVGYKAIQSTGVVGKRTVTYEVHIKDGVEVARVEIASVTTVAPVEQVEIVGSKPKSLPYDGSDSKSDWLAASVIAEENWGYADFLVTKESGWNPRAVNRFSGACGLAQALPCKKLGPNWDNPVVALNWMNNYVNRYGGWEGAYRHWVANRWY